VEGGKPKAVMIQGGLMSKEIGAMAKKMRPTQLEKTIVIRHFAMKWSSSAHVENFSIRTANKGLG